MKSVFVLDLKDGAPESIEQYIKKRLKDIKLNFEGSVDSPATRAAIRSAMQTLASEIESLSGIKPEWDLYLNPWTMKFDQALVKAETDAE
jgi:hypothetical protein